MNFGAFAGGFAEGFERGQRIGKSIRDTIRENKIDEMRQQAMEDARKAREQAISGLITTQPDENQQPKSGEIAEPYKPSTDGLPKPNLSSEGERAQEVSRSSPTRNPDSAAANTAEASMPQAELSKPKPLLVVLGTPETGGPKGLLETGNIDINNRPVMKNPDGSISTEQSITIGIDGGKQVLIPTIINGQKVSNEQAIEHFKKTGEHLGIFDSPENADAYGNALHERQAQFYGSGQQPVGETTGTVGAVPQPDIQQRDLPVQQQDQRFPTATGKPGEPMQQAAAPEPAQSAMAQAPTPQAAPAAPQAPAPSSTQNAVASTGVATQTPQPVKIQGKYVVNGKGYATMGEAKKAAEASAPSEMELFMRNGVPKIAQEYMAQGDPVKAEAWTKYAEAHKTQQNMKEWASMYRAAQMGDMETAANHAFKLYQSYEDGITPLSKETVKDKDGNITGFNVRLKNDKTGEVTSQFIDKGAMIEMGLAALSPPQMFEMAWKRKAEADKVALEARVKAQERKEKLQDQLAVEGYKEDRADARDRRRGQQKLSEITLTKQLEAANLGERERAKAEGKIGMLKDAGYSDEQIAGMMPAIVGAGEYKKVTDPQERRALIYSDLTKNDPSFARLPKEKQEARVQQAMEVIYGGAAPGQPAPAQAPQPGAAAPGTPAPAPAAAPGSAAPGAAQAAPKPTGNPAFDKAAEGAMFKDSKGNVYQKKNGVPVLVKPAQAAAGPAGGMPTR